MNLYALNVTVDTSCLVILLTLFISQSYRRANGRPDWFFSICLAVNMINIFAELMAWMLEGYGSPFLMFLQHVFNAGAYLNAGIAYTVLFVYLLYELNGRGSFTDRDKLLTAVTCVPALILIILAMTNFHTRLLFSFDENYHYVRGPLARIYDTFMFFEQFLLIYAVMRKNEADWKVRVKVSMSAVMLMASALLDIIFSDIELTYPATVFVLLMIYLNLLLVAEKQIESTELEIVSGRYNLILGKMRPAFVSFVLEKVEELCLEDTEKAQWTISEFSDYLRGNIDKIDRNELIPFEDEYEHVAHYINLVHLRYENFVFSSDLEITGFQIPVRTILPIAEQYVIAYDSFIYEPKIIKIHTWSRDGMIFVDVSGPSMMEHGDIQKGYELYNYVTARLSIIKGAELSLYCDKNHTAHSVISYPQSSLGGACV
jgi:hypothetical protein